jgi:4-hydroxythreonine-4-phosphate dehydrogenase
MTSSIEYIKVGMTIGDPNGIGIETIIKVFLDTRMFEHITPVIYGNAELIKAHLKNLDIPDFRHEIISDAADSHPKVCNIINVWEEHFEVQFGEPSKEAGKLAFKSLEAAVQDLASNKVDVLVTAPINKDSIQSEEFKFPGHTEYLSEMSNVEDSLMFLVSSKIRIGVVTGHLPLKDVSAAISEDAILRKMRIMSDSLKRDMGITKPRIAVLGLNPHAGDNGLLGAEEKEIIAPAIKTANEEGIMAFGPYGADGFFGTGQYTKFDAVLAMYHDQGLTPFKALFFDQGVNYTAGLPIVRTSPDHGTGYEIAGKNQASSDSMRSAIFLAVDVYQNRKLFKEITANPLEIKKTRRVK